MMRKLVNLSELRDRRLRFTAFAMLHTEEVSLSGCPEKRCALFHTCTTSTTENFF
jgi:hypothetical protein